MSVLGSGHDVEKGHFLTNEGVLVYSLWCPIADHNRSGNGETPGDLSPGGIVHKYWRDGQSRRGQMRPFRANYFKPQGPVRESRVSSR